MASCGTILSYPNNVRSFKALIAAKYAGVTVDLEKGFEFGKTNKTPEYLKDFPTGKVPVFYTTDKKPIFESSAIATYVALQDPKTRLLGETAYEKALVHTFSLFAETELCPSASTILYPLFGYMPYNKANHDAAVSNLKRSLGALDKWLSTRTYVAAEYITLADIILAVQLVGLYTKFLDNVIRAPFTNVNRYFLTLVNQPNFAAVLGEVKLCEKAELYDEAIHGKKPEAAKPAATEEEEAPAPKAKNYLDELPPSSFNLDAWKKFYSNNSEADSIKYFWDNIDLEGWSLWRIDFRYNEENAAVFMSCNLLNGFFQRTEHGRKYAFGSYLIFGEDNNNEITGFILCRGDKIIPMIEEAPDFESYKTTRIEVTEENKQMINAYLAWAEIPGVASFSQISKLPFNQGKIYK